MRKKKITHIFLENEPLMRETNFTLDSIQKYLYLLLLYQFTFAQNRPKSDISGALGSIHYITLKAFAVALGDGTKCKTCFVCPRMVPEKTSLFKLGVWFGVTHKVKVKLIISLNSIYNLSKVLS